MLNDYKDKQSLAYNLFVNDIKTEFVISDDKLPKNQILKFNQDFILNIDDKELFFLLKLMNKSIYD